MLQQYLPFTVLKRRTEVFSNPKLFESCNSTYRLRYWNCLASNFVYIIFIWVATVLTVYGIETFYNFFVFKHIGRQLQQYLPFTVLKHNNLIQCKPTSFEVATVLTVYGIETEICKGNRILQMSGCNSTYRLRYWNYKKS